MRCTRCDALHHDKPCQPPRRSVTLNIPNKEQPLKGINKPFEHRNKSSVTDVCQHQSNLFLSPVFSADRDATQHLKPVALLHQT